MMNRLNCLVSPMVCGSYAVVFKCLTSKNPQKNLKNLLPTCGLLSVSK